MQAASWVGRQYEQPLGGVAAHLYAEFDGAGLDIARLSLAISRLYQSHPMLRLRITPEGRQTIENMDDRYRLQIDDWQGDSQCDADRYLADKRQSKTTQKLPLERGLACDISVSLLPEGRCRLHVDLDMIAADAQSFRILMEDLTRFYRQPGPPAGNTQVAYFRYLDRMRGDKSRLKRYQNDKQWWHERLPAIPPAPALPQSPVAGHCRSNRLAGLLTQPERRTLAKIARTHHLTLATLFLCAFAGVVGHSCGMTRFRLNVPMFHRRPYVKEAERIIGDFSNLVILDVAYDPAESLLTFCRRTASRLARLITHSHYPGVNVLRDLSRHHGNMQIAPLVFTSGLGLPGGKLFSDEVLRTFGEMNWVISQGPQVALDAQVVEVRDGILVNWDVRLDLFPKPIIRPLFDSYLNLMRQLALTPDTLNQPLESMLMPRQTAAIHSPPPSGAEPILTRGNNMQTPLTSLQQAYLLGRSEQWPLGGVAMQDFREYRGTLPAATLRQRLTELVRRHEALRTRIDPHMLIQYVSPETVINLDEIDLRDIPRGDALRQVDEIRRARSHTLNNLTLSPWHIWIITLAEGAGHQDDDFTTVVFTSFDALILDGSSISTIITRLFDGAEPMPQSFPLRIARPDNSEPALLTRRRLDDRRYWREKLQHLPPPPAFPWREPLASIRSSPWRRESLRLPRRLIRRISAIGAAHGLFQNSILSAAILETLSLWLRGGALPVGIPVSFPSADGRLGNASTFVVISFTRTRDASLNAARRLQQDILESLQHLTFSGVDLTRLLLKQHGESPALPVVLTNGLSWESPPADSPMRFHSGLTQTPQVAMDIRLSLDQDKNLLLCLDYAEHALDQTIVQDMLQAIAARIALTCRQTAQFPMPAQFIDYHHYHHNGDERDYIGSGFLNRIAHHLFAPSPDKAAIHCGPRTISYAQLGQSVQTAMTNLRRYGMKKGNVVALALPRSPAHLTITLACALQGIIWVPIDINSPPERMAYLLTNCQPDLIVSVIPVGEMRVVQPAALLSPVELAALDLPDASLSERSHSRDPAYYLYTSGTTGKPKCVVLSYRATDNVIGRTLEKWGVGQQDVFISVTPLHHDMSVFDLFGSLCAGATLVIPEPHEEKDAISWNRLVERHRVTLWCSVPAILDMLLSCTQDDRLRSLRLIAQGGDYIRPATIRALRARLADARLFSLGGPTETTIWSIWHEITADDSDTIPYGKPLPANRYFICHDTGEHCPAYVVGRIYTAGVNLALGYLENGILCQHDFVTLTDPAGEPVRAFRTGDEGYYRKDGNIIFANRVNGYVKIRGIRVSLPEIESALDKHPSIKEVAVVDYPAGETGEITLGAMYTSQQGDAIPIAELRAFVSRHLPCTHVPTRMIHATALPLSANGKTDRRRIKESFIAERSAGVTARDAAIADEQTRCCQRILGIYLHAIGIQHGERFDEDSAFMTMGLKPSHLQPITIRLNETFGVRLSPYDLVKCNNARHVSRLLQQT